MAAETSSSTARPVAGPAGALAASPEGMAHRVMAWIGPAASLDRPGARRELVRAVRPIPRDGGPVILINWLFQCLETYTGVIRQTSIESYLCRADPRRFGVEPTVCLFTHSTPLLTDDLALHAQRGLFELHHRGLVGASGGLIVSAVANFAPTLRMRWPRLAHGS